MGLPDTIGVDIVQYQRFAFVCVIVP